MSSCTVHTSRDNNAALLPYTSTKKKKLSKQCSSEVSYYSSPKATRVLLIDLLIILSLFSYLIISYCIFYDDHQEKLSQDLVFIYVEQKIVDVITIMDKKSTNMFFHRWKWIGHHSNMQDTIQVTQWVVTQRTSQINPVITR